LPRHPELFPINLPFDASSYCEEIEPLVARRTHESVRCGLNLEP
jgi:hypothetical protein